MREITFRGKRVDNGEWVYGDLLQNIDVVKIREREKDINRIAKRYVCNPETVGQFTGLTDKNGKMIFEGDIISAIALDTGEEQRAVVGFGRFIDVNNDDEYIGFYIEFYGHITTIAQLEMEEIEGCFEVIGNIHDNPEIMEVE